MWPLGHAAVGYLCYSLAARRGWLPRLDAPVLLALLFGTQFPDLIDKPFAWYLGILPTGRSLAHSLLFLVPVALLVVLLTRRLGREAVGIAFAFGALSHTFLDSVPTLWTPGLYVEYLFWPLTPVGAPEGGSYPTVLGLLVAHSDDPYFWLEFVLGVLALARWRGDGYPGTEVLRSVRGRLRPTQSAD